MEVRVGSLFNTIVMQKSCKTRKAIHFAFNPAFKLTLTHSLCPYICTDLTLKSDLHAEFRRDTASWYVFTEIFHTS